MSDKAKKDFTSGQIRPEERPITPEEILLIELRFAELYKKETGEEAPWLGEENDSDISLDPSGNEFNLG